MLKMWNVNDMDRQIDNRRRPQNDDNSSTEPYFNSLQVFFIFFKYFLQFPYITTWLYSVSHDLFPPPTPPPKKTFCTENQILHHKVNRPCFI
jgi:hypothetical protein